MYHVKKLYTHPTKRLNMRSTASDSDGFFLIAKSKTAPKNQASKKRIYNLFIFIMRVLSS